MPYFQTPETIDRAIKSLTDQTFQDWRLSIVVDGCEPPQIIADPRIRMFVLPVNRGAFYASALNLAVCAEKWWTIHDSDDYTDPDRFEAMIKAAKGFQGVYEEKTVHRLDGTRKRVRGSHNGLFDTEKLRICGPHPDFRVSWDDAIMTLYKRAYPVAVMRKSRYHGVKRPNSLTIHPDTGMQSEYRKKVHPIRRDLIDRCMKVRPSQWPEILKPKPETQAALEKDIARYRQEIQW